MTTSRTTSGPAGGLPGYLPVAGNRYLFSPSDTREIIARELDVTRLETMIDRGLWLAGRLSNIRPLHRQSMLQRHVIVTEQMDLHLLWHQDTIYIKPLAEWMLDETTIKQYINPNQSTHASHTGFLLTYFRLIVHPSDFHIAKSSHLLPDSIATWADWQTFSIAHFPTLLADIKQHRKPISPRFLFGELRLSRVNMIYRFHPAYRLRHFLRGYYDQSSNYESFLRRNFAWLIAVFAYITVVLTAMQVGLGTTQLRDNGPFNRASYGFTVFAILLPLAVLAVAMLASLLLTVHNIRLTRKHLQDNLR